MFYIFQTIEETALVQNVLLLFYEMQILEVICTI